MADFTTSLTCGVLSWTITKMAIVFTKETLLSFRSHCGCYIFIWVMEVTLSEQPEALKDWESKTELFWACLRALHWLACSCNSCLNISVLEDIHLASLLIFVGASIVYTWCRFYSKPCHIFGGVYSQLLYSRQSEINSFAEGPIKFRSSVHWLGAYYLILCRKFSKVASQCLQSFTALLKLERISNIWGTEFCPYFKSSVVLNLNFQ